MLFDFELPPDNSQIEDCNITTILLYFSDQEGREFKEMCKRLMIKKFPKNYEEQNISELLFQLVKEQL